MRRAYGVKKTLHAEGRCECENGHEFCDHYVIGDWEDDDRNDISAKQCPICSMGTLTSESILSYLCKTEGINIEMIASKMRSQFTNIMELDEFLKTK